MSLGITQTGVVSTLKNDAEDASVLAADKIAKDMQEMDSLEIAEDEVVYQANGEPVFNCFSAKGKKIVFKAGRYVAKVDDTDTCDTLDHFCSTNVLTKVED